MAKRECIRVCTVVANDDAASAPIDAIEKRRGVAGEIVMWKVAGARAAQGASLDEVIEDARHAVDETRSIGVGLSASTIPAVGKSNFTIRNGEMEVGIGQHGEPGILNQATLPARDVSKLMFDKLATDLPFTRGDKISLLLSGLGPMPLMEQYILYAEIAVCANRALRVFMRGQYLHVAGNDGRERDADQTRCRPRCMPRLFLCQSIGITLGDAA